MALGGGLKLGAEFHDARGGACGLGVDAEWILGTEVEIALDSETESDPGRPAFAPQRPKLGLFPAWRHVGDEMEDAR